MRLGSLTTSATAEIVFALSPQLDCATVDEPSGHSTADGKRRLADRPRWPVLARLPDVSNEAQADRARTQSKPGGAMHRFDPPQSQSANQTSASRTPPTATASQPHFERKRPAAPRGIPRRVSPILPKSDPFAIPSSRLIDSLAPAVRFMTMVALFTAAGIWLQMKGHNNQAAPSIEPATTAQRRAAAPAKNAGDHTTPAPTATGPIEKLPQTGARVGRVGSNDFSAAATPTEAIRPSITPSLAPPHYLISGASLPRVQTSDSQQPGLNDDPTAGHASGAGASSPVDGAIDSSTEESTSVARIPGFLIAVPTK
jgi:hypothetical protein